MTGSTFHQSNDIPCLRNPKLDIRSRGTLCLPFLAIFSFLFFATVPAATNPCSRIPPTCMRCSYLLSPVLDYGIGGSTCTCCSPSSLSCFPSTTATCCSSLTVWSETAAVIKHGTWLVCCLSLQARTLQSAGRGIASAKHSVPAASHSSRLEEFLPHMPSRVRRRGNGTYLPRPTFITFIL